MKNKWLRVLVCFVVVCCILVNISPIRAEASVVAAYIGVEAANRRIQAKTKWMPPSKFREASMMAS